MKLLRWLVVLMTYLCVPGLGSKCCDSSVCSDLSDKRRILTGVHSVQVPDARRDPRSQRYAQRRTPVRLLLALLGPEDRNAANNEERRSYSMEHFRWGKPPGRKRRPVKVFASSQEAGDSPEVFFPRQARRQRSSNRDERGHPRKRGSSRTPTQLNQQGGKNGTYQMNHFRWGSPNVSKRNDKSVKTRLRQLAKLFRTIIDKKGRKVFS
uniref:Pro-opiomelanocortin/corticotropin ACTH central region domain-containing protein n=1 Tax=Tetraodon nigroviridis TaxID=99883 RepID=H3C776_TETNG